MEYVELNDDFIFPWSVKRVYFAMPKIKFGLTFTKENSHKSNSLFGSTSFILFRIIEII